MKNQLNLGQLISLLEICEQDSKVRYDFGRFEPTHIDSYRGYYDQLALSFVESKYDEDQMTVSRLLKILNEAVGHIYMGYKGGEYTMTKKTPVWVANYGDCHDTAIIGVIDDGYIVVIETGYIS